MSLEEDSKIKDEDVLSLDLEELSKRRIDPFTKDGITDADRFMEFLDAYNEFIGHRPGPFRRIIDKDMRL